MSLVQARLQRLRYAWARVREEGLLWTLRELGERALLVLLWLLLLPVTVTLHVAGFRRLSVITERVGHFAAEIDCFLKLQALDKLPHGRYFVTAPPARVANDCLADYWASKLSRVREPRLCALLAAMGRLGLMRHDVTDYILTVHGAATYYRVNAEWAGRPPLLELSPEHALRGRARLSELGLPPDAWFVCVHVREEGYSSGDEKVHAYRNAEVQAIVPAIRAIAERGGWCVRMGDPATTPLPAVAGAIDYAHHPLRSAEMDVFLCASCRFFLGDTSGLFVLSSIFGVPCALANLVPFSIMGYAPRDLSIPKLLFGEREQRVLSFPEVFSLPASNYRMGRMFREAGLGVKDNTPEEIGELAVEMLDRLEGRTESYAALEPLQDAFKRLLRPAHYCYGAASRIGARFLERHRNLLGV
jgi:putative glycosyltransferase (TIGR04372 family)